jgi:hypothetical protein
MYSLAIVNECLKSGRWLKGFPTLEAARERAVSETRNARKFYLVRIHGPTGQEIEQHRGQH